MTRSFPPACALLLLPLAGCVGPHAWTRSLGATPLPWRAAVETAGGYRLEIGADQGLVARPDPDDLAACLGAEVAATGTALVVVARLRPEGELLPGDAILRAAPRRPLPDEKGRMSRPRDVAGLRGEGHPVAGPDDLRRYGMAWTLLDLLVLRDGVEVAITQEVARPQSVAAPAWKPEVTLPLGFLACDVERLPAGMRPKRGGLLVTHVSLGSPLALQGLRPLDTLSKRSDDELRDQVEVYPAGGGAPWEADCTPPEPNVDFELLAGLLVEVEGDPAHLQVSVGPFGRLFHYHSRAWYDARTDRYGDTGAWSVLGLVCCGSTSLEGRRDTTEWQLSAAILADGARGSYENDRFE